MNAARTEAGQGDPVARFKQAQKEFIQVAGVADFDPKAKTRAGELREEMKQASQEIAQDPARMRAAEREGFAPGQELRSPSRAGARAKRPGESRRTKGLSGRHSRSLKGGYFTAGTLLYVNVYRTIQQCPR